MTSEICPQCAHLNTFDEPAHRGVWTGFCGGRPEFTEDVRCSNCGFVVPLEDIPYVEQQAA